MSLTWPETPKTGFLVTRLILSLSSVNATIIGSFSCFSTAQVSVIKDHGRESGGVGCALLVYMSTRAALEHIVILLHVYSKT